MYPIAHTKTRRGTLFLGARAHIKYVTPAKEMKLRLGKTERNYNNVRKFHYDCLREEEKE